MRMWQLALVLAAALSSNPAWADLAWPNSYYVKEFAPGRVGIGLNNQEGRTCPDQGLLRRNVDTGEIVKITTCDGTSFLDDCVLAGTYQYGLAVPYECAPGPEPTDYYVTLQVAGAPGGCAHVPEVEVSTVPWGSSDLVCENGDDRGSGGGCGLDPSGRVVGTNLALLLAGLAAWGWRAARRSRA